MSKIEQLALACVILLIAGAVAAQEPDLALLQKQVADTERAFAKTMVLSLRPSALSCLRMFLTC